MPKSRRRQRDRREDQHALARPRRGRRAPAGPCRPWAPTHASTAVLRERMRWPIAAPAAACARVITLGETTAHSRLPCDPHVPVAFGQIAGHPRRPALARRAQPRGHRSRDARDPPRAARGRRQLPRRQDVRRRRARALGRAGGAVEPDARPAGREDRRRGADGAARRRGHEADVRRQAADRDPALRPAGLGQDDGRRQAREPARQAGPEARAGGLRPAAPGRRRAAQDARAAGRRPGLRPRHRRRSRSRSRATASRRRPRRAATS